MTPVMVRIQFRLVWCVLAVASASGCVRLPGGVIGDTVPTVDRAPLPIPAEPGNGGGDGDASLSRGVQPIFSANCVMCHGAAGGLSLAEGEAFAALVDVASSGAPNRKRVVPGNADESYLVMKVRGDDGISGSRMPPGGELSQAQIDTIVAWIQAGALDD